MWGEEGTALEKRLSPSEIHTPPHPRIPFRRPLLSLPIQHLGLQRAAVTAAGPLAAVLHVDEQHLLGAVALGQPDARLHQRR